MVALLGSGCATTAFDINGCDRGHVTCVSKSQEGLISLPVLDNRSDSQILSTNNLPTLCLAYRRVNKDSYYAKIPANSKDYYKNKLLRLISVRGFTQKEMDLIKSNQFSVGMSENALKCSVAQFNERDPYESVSHHRTWRAFELWGVRGYRFHSENGIISGWRKSDLY